MSYLQAIEEVMDKAPPEWAEHGVDWLKANGLWDVVAANIDKAVQKWQKAIRARDGEDCKWRHRVLSDSEGSVAVVEMSCGCLELEVNAPRIPVVCEFCKRLVVWSTEEGDSK